MTLDRRGSSRFLLQMLVSRMGGKRQKLICSLAQQEEIYRWTGIPSLGGKAYINLVADSGGAPDSGNMPRQRGGG